MLSCWLLLPAQCCLVNSPEVISEMLSRSDCHKMSRNIIISNTRVFSLKPAMKANTRQIHGEKRPVPQQRHRLSVDCIRQSISSIFKTSKFQRIPSNQVPGPNWEWKITFIFLFENCSIQQANFCFLSSNKILIRMIFLTERWRRMVNIGAEFRSNRYCFYMHACMHMQRN